MCFLCIIDFSLQQAQVKLYHFYAPLWHGYRRVEMKQIKKIIVEIIINRLNKLKSYMHHELIHN